MKLLIVRHGDPDYSIDSLTEKRLERSGIFIRTAFKAGYKGFLCFTTGKGTGYGVFYIKENGAAGKSAAWCMNLMLLCVNRIIRKKIQ